MTSLISFATEKGVVYNVIDYNRSKSRIEMRLKAYIARNVWGDSGFYPIWNSNDLTIKAALETNMKDLKNEN